MPRHEPLRGRGAPVRIRYNGRMGKRNRRMFEDWAKFAGFSAFLAVALASGLTWALPNLFFPNPIERSLAECGDLSHQYECLVAAYTGQLATFTEWLVAVTAILIIVGIYQAAQLKRAVDTAEKSDETLQRAYVWPGFGKHEPLHNGMKWFVTVTNTGQTAGILQAINYAVITQKAYEAGGFKFERFIDREDIIAPSTQNPGQETGLDFTIDGPMICCGWIEYEDVFGRIRKRGWKHRLNLTPDSAGNFSNPLPGCYSLNYKPWGPDSDD